jgi:hypothetical protein
MGILHFPAGGVYAGEWKKGMKHGKGKAVMESGDTYIGDWRFDRQQYVLKRKNDVEMKE